MGEQIIQQPDGRLAVWSTVVDDWTIFDATRDDLINHYVVRAAIEARSRTEALIDQVLAEARPYFQFTMTFDEAQARRTEIHGNAPWPPNSNGDGGEDDWPYDDAAEVEFADGD